MVPALRALTDKGGGWLSPSHCICPYDIKTQNTVKNCGISDEGEVTNTNLIEFFPYNKYNSIRDVYPVIVKGQFWFNVDVF